MVIQIRKKICGCNICKNKIRCCLGENDIICNLCKNVLCKCNGFGKSKTKSFVLKGFGFRIVVFCVIISKKKNDKRKKVVR